MNIKNSKNIISAIVAAGSIMLSAEQTKAETCHVYNVNIQGIATVGDANYTSGSQQFSVNQWAIIRSGYANNPVEFSLATGTDLNASAQIGQIELSTNSAFARNSGIASQQYDLARVTESRNEVSAVYQFELDSGASFILPPPNVFVSVGPAGTGCLGLELLPSLGALVDQICGANSPLSVSYFIPRNGGGYFFSPDGTWTTIAGEVQLIGSGPDNPNYQGRYQGQFTGTYYNNFQC